MAEQPKKGVTLFLASKLKYDEEVRCLVSVGAPVVVKAVP